MTTMTQPGTNVIVGVDTHRDFHVAAVLDPLGRLLGTEQFAADTSGYQSLVDWAQQFGHIDIAGIEGTGSWGAGLMRHVTSWGVQCVEVNRPNRQHRRRHRKSDATDAIGAARSVLSGESNAIPRGHNGPAESLRMVRVAHRSAHKARTQTINALRNLISTSPDKLRSQFAGLTRHQTINKAAALRPANSLDPTTIAKTTMRSLARRVQHLNNEIADLEAIRDQLVHNIAPPELMNQPGIGTAVAADLLIALGDNPNRITTDAKFAALCGVSPVDASSGRQQRHRLNRGGDRQANKALWRIVLVRLGHHQPTRDYMTKQLANGKTKRETIRNLKRYTARQIWRLLQHHPPHLD